MERKVRLVCVALCVSFLVSGKFLVWMRKDFLGGRVPGLGAVEADALKKIVSLGFNVFIRVIAAGVLCGFHVVLLLFNVWMAS